MALQDHAEPSTNEMGTVSKSGTWLTPSGSRDVLEQTRRDLIVMRNKHGATSPTGCRCSNIVELIQMPNPPAFQLKRQMDGLQRAMRAAQ